MDWIHQLFMIPADNAGFAFLIIIIRRIVAFIGVFIILWGAAVATYHFVTRNNGSNKVLDTVDLIRLQFGKKIILGLEFIVAADVIETTTAPDYYTVGILASLVGIRTLLTYFMNREMITLAKKK